jgi:hypothetical protein
MSRKRKARPAPPAAKPHWTAAVMWSLSLFFWIVFLLDRVFGIDVPVWLLLTAIAAELAFAVWAVCRRWRARS